MNISKGRLSQYIKVGLPVEPDGRVDEDKARAWIAANVDPLRSEAARAARVERHPPGQPPCQQHMLSGEVMIVAVQRYAFIISRDFGLSVDLARKIAVNLCVVLWGWMEQELKLPEGTIKIEEKILELPLDYVPTPVPEPKPGEDLGWGRPPPGP